MPGFLDIFKREKEKDLGYIKDYATGVPVKATNDELRRQFVERKLINDFGYPKELIGIDVDVVVDGRLLGKVDLVIFRDSNHKDPVKNAFAVILIKSGGLQRLKELLSATNAEYGLLYSYSDFVVFRKSADGIEEVCRFPMYGENFENLDSALNKGLLRPTSELGTQIDDIYRLISEAEGLKGGKLLQEFLKLLMLKVGDEVLSDVESLAWISNSEFSRLNKGLESEGFNTRLSVLVDKTKSLFARMELSPAIRRRSVAEVFRRLHGVSILKCSDISKFESLRYVARQHMNVDRGEVLTPYPIADLMVRLINPGKNELVLDPACGSGRLIAWAIKHVRDMNNLSFDELTKFVKENVLCIDINSEIIKLATAYIALYSGASGNTLAADVLAPFDLLSEVGRKESIPDHLIPSPEKFDVILVHPPFNLKERITHQPILHQYELGHKWNYDRRTSRWVKSDEISKEQLVEVLFIERCFQMLKMYGRMAIILPEEILAVGNLGYVRQWLLDNVRVLATVSIPQQAFIPYGIKARSFLLMVQKLPKDELDKLKISEYKMFVANLEKVGYDAFGSPIYKRGKSGELITDEFGNPVIDTDVQFICDKFKEFKSDQGLNF
ncbi:MAG: N-6 DNA methylase [Sulfolobales archaeon]|nr:N-6 DNA methylase [Sulfolobales archaeon]MCX8186035.1 N-6 DNA methylase [Sulfolobales archaeon]MDW7969330.1 N-6 DNA methylase [Sulfolobales archaeon]